MPFRSVKQRRYLAWKKPTIYQRWKRKHGKRIVPKKRRRRR